jgi:hypothetical protein
MQAVPEKKKSNFSLFLQELTVVGGATAISRTLVAPLERVKLVLQGQKMVKFTEKERFSGMTNALSRISSEQGFFSFWRGNWANLFRIIPNTMIRFTTYDTLKKMALPKGDHGYEGFEKFFRKMEAAIFSGLVTLMISYPFDVVRTRMALDFSKSGEPRLYKGIFDCMKKTVRSEGFFSLYSGFWVTCAGILPHVSVSLVTYDTLKDTLLEKKEQEDTVTQVLNFIGVGTIAGIFATTVSYPFDTVRRRIQLNGALGSEKLYKNSIDCFRKMIAKEGPSSLYLGFVPNLVKIAPAAAIQFAAYDMLRQNVNELKIF